MRDEPANVRGAPNRRNRVFGSGELADLTRAFDWSQTPLGAIERWPDVLLSTVNLLLASRHPMFLWWGEQLNQFYNDAYRPSLGADKHPAALGQAGAECWPEIWPIISPQIAAVMANGEASWHEDQLVPIIRDGRLEDVYWTYGYSPVRDSEGSIGGTLVTCSNTTSRVLAEKGLQEERTRFADLFQQAPAFFAVLRGPEHLIEMTNPLYQKLVGGRNVIGKPVREALPGSEEQGLISILNRVYVTEEPIVGRGERFYLTPGPGQPLDERVVDFVYQPVHGSDGVISSMIVLGVDVTDSKRAEHALLKAEKLAAVGRLAASMAHEINNPLAAVTNLLYLADQSSTLHEIKEHVHTAQRELRRVSVIANRVLRFNNQSVSPLAVKIDELIGDVLFTYAGRILNSRIDVELRLRATVPVMCFEGEIRQVLNNLVANSIEAMLPNGGRLLLRSREATNWRTGSRGLILTIADTGSGMTSVDAAKIYEPFFTTKGNTNTGLGLWVSKDIVARHNGTLDFRSSQRNSGSGTVFNLFLPFETASQTYPPKPELLRAS